MYNHTVKVARLGHYARLLKSRGGAHIQVFGGGGGVIVPSEIKELQAYGVSRIYSPEDGQKMGLAGMIGEMVMRCDKDLSPHAPSTLKAIQGHEQTHWRALAQLIADSDAEAVARALELQHMLAGSSLESLAASLGDALKRYDFEQANAWLTALYERAGVQP